MRQLESEAHGETSWNRRSKTGFIDQPVECGDSSATPPNSRLAGGNRQRELVSVAAGKRSSGNGVNCWPTQSLQKRTTRRSRQSGTACSLLWPRRVSGLMKAGVWSWQVMTASRSIRPSSTNSWPHDCCQSKALRKLRYGDRGLALNRSSIAEPLPGILLSVYSTETRTMPDRIMPSARAALTETSTMRPRTNGPRSLMRQRMERPR